MADPKIIYLTKSVHDLVKEYPELIPLMKELGFTRITEKTALNTLGRFMTIPKGAMMMHIDMGKVISTLLAHGFTLGGSFAQAPEEKAAPSEETAPDERTARITEYIRRLSAGEDLEKVRADFVKHFKDVDPGEIALAEQSLLKGGVPLRDVQRLCDVHSALFHGTTRAEKIAAAEAKVQESLGRRSPAALERPLRSPPLHSGTSPVHPFPGKRSPRQSLGKGAKSDGNRRQSDGRTGSAPPDFLPLQQKERPLPHPEDELRLLRPLGRHVERGR